MSRRAVFLDRDGTLTREVHYLQRLEEMELLPGAVEAVRRLNHEGRLAVVITNQSAVARGLLSESQLRGLNRYLCRLFEQGKARIDALYYCPHHPEVGSAPYRRRCGCRKPEPGLLLRAARELGIRLSGSYMIGDHLKDVEAGHRAGCRAILVRTGYGEKEEERLGSQAAHLPSHCRPDHVCGDVLEGVEWVLGRDIEDAH